MFLRNMKKRTEKTALNFQTYGTINPIIKARIEIKERFKPNKHSIAILKNQGLKLYIPKINGLRLIIGLIGVVVCVVIPIITPLGIVPLLWGLK